MVPPFKIQLMTGAEMMQVLQNAEVLEGFTTKLKVEYDDKDLEGLMQMAQWEKLSLSQVLAIIQEQERKDEEGNVEREQVFHKFVFGHLY